MDIERGFLEILFKKIPYTELYEKNNIGISKIKKETFCKYSNEIFPQYSDDEKLNIYDLFDMKINSDASFLEITTSLPEKSTFSPLIVPLLYATT